MNSNNSSFEDSKFGYVFNSYSANISSTLERPSIRYFLPDGKYQESEKDEGVIELEGYRYDKQKSEKEGINCYVKDKDHSRDAEAYILALFKETGRAPVV